MRPAYVYYGNPYTCDVIGEKLSQASGHYLNQWWPNIYAAPGGDRVKLTLIEYGCNELHVSMVDVICVFNCL